MDSRKSILGLVAALAVTVAGAVNAATITVDFTNQSVLSDLLDDSTFSVGGITFTATSNKQLKAGDGLPTGTFSFCTTYGLACQKDGLGAGGNPDEFDTKAGSLLLGEYVEFSVTPSALNVVDLVGFFVLDMFKEDQNNVESVYLTVDDTGVGEYFSDQTDFSSPGFNAFVATGVFVGDPAHSFTAIEDITTVRFDPGLGNDGRGLPDFALAGFVLEVTPVPLPAAAWLFISALVVLGYLGKRKASA